MKLLYNIILSIKLAFQFLTVIPIKTEGELSESKIAGSSMFFLLVGAFQGLILVFLTVILLRLFSPEITSVLILLAYTLTNSGFHQDGLSDTFDAMSVKSTGNKDKDRLRRLSVMKDSTAGPIGITAIIFSLLLKYLLIKAILQTKIDAGLILCLMPVYSKWAMISVMYNSKGARNDGIGRIFLEHFRLKYLILSTVLLVFISFVVFCASHCCLSFIHTLSNKGFIIFLFCQTFIIYSLCSFLKYIFTNKFDGLTGDNFGAIHEISEIVFLLMALLFTQLYLEF